VPPAAVKYEELEHVALTREFLAAPERFLSKLLRDG
jgi:predicted ATPase